MIRVVFAINNKLYCDGVAFYLKDRSEFVVQASVYSVPELLSTIERQIPAVVVMDTTMADAIVALGTILKSWPEIRVVAIALADEDADVLRWAEAGAAGLLTRDNPLEQLVDSIMAASRGEVSCSSRVAATLVRRVAALAGKGEPTPMSDLTRRQARVLALITDGLSNKEIARALGIEVSTVKNHVHQLLTKLNVTRRCVAAAVARRQGVGASVQRVVFWFAWLVSAAPQAWMST
jgi:two-component system nitrate/nitrite response regulator NarL